MKIELAGEECELSPSGALYLRAQRTLVLADMHLGKAQSLRVSGVPVPSGTTDSDLLTLCEQISHYDTERVISLGDMFESARGHSEELILKLCQLRSINPSVQIINILGNHDRASSEFAERVGVKFVEELHEPPFLFRHEPQDQPKAYLLCGHVHPAVVLRDVTGERLRFKAFYIGHRYTVLPAFGSLTGGVEVSPERGSKYVAIVENQLVRIENW